MPCGNPGYINLSKVCLAVERDYETALFSAVKCARSARLVPRNSDEHARRTVEEKDREI
jgi:hypothetical protein